MITVEDTFDQQSYWDDILDCSGIFGNAASSDYLRTNDSGRIEIDVSPVNVFSNGEKCQRKRGCYGSCSRTKGSKAWREKMRREKMNDRFAELCAILEPRSSSKTDKSVLLVDAIRVLNHLRTEAQELKGKNEKLQEEIKDLKAQKSKLRDQKLQLKCSKDELVKQVKSVAVQPAGVMPPHQIPLYHAPTNKVMASGYGGYPMWHWIPPTILDTSQDHVLRPPVA